MFCKNCGKENMDNAKFCINCGQILSAESSETTVSENKEKLFAEIEEAKNYVHEAERIFVENSNIETATKKLKNFVNLKKSSKFGKLPNELKECLNVLDINFSKMKLKYMCGVLFAIIVDVVLFLKCVSLVKACNASDGFETAVMIMLFTPGTLILQIIVTVLIEKFISYGKQIKNLMPQIDAKYNEWYSNAYSHYSEYIQKYINNNGYIPAKYLSINALNYIQEAIRNKRADSLKEALNLYEDYETKQKIIRQNDERYLALQAELDAIHLNQQRQRGSNGVTNALLITDLLLNIG